MTDPTVFVTIAEALRRASGNDRATPVAERLDGDIDNAYVVQAINRQQWAADGRSLTGYKVAFSTAESQKLFGTTEPVYGTLFGDMRVDAGGTVPAGALGAPKVEGEIVLELGADLEGEDLTDEEIRAAVAAVYVGIEIPDSPIDGKLTAVDMAAANAAAAAYVLGARHAVGADFDTASITLAMKHNDSEVSSGLSSVCMGDPVNVLIWLARRLAGAGIPMRAGQIVFAGSLVPILSAEPGDSFEANAGELGSVSVTFGR